MLELEERQKPSRDEVNALANQLAPNTQRRNKSRTSRLQKRYSSRRKLTAPSAITQTYAQIDAPTTAPDTATTIKYQESIFPFLKLPAELRMLVYVELLALNDRLVIGWHGPRCHSWSQKTIYPAILRTCRLVHQETAAVLYGGNVFQLRFTLDPSDYGASFIKHIGPYNASLIRILDAQISFASEAHHIAYATLAVEASLAAETSLAAKTPSSRGTAYVNKSHVTAIVATFGIDFAQLRMLLIRLWPCDKTELSFGWKAAGIEDPTEQLVEIPSADIERAADIIVERKKGWLKGVTPGWKARWFLYERNCDD